MKNLTAQQRIERWETLLKQSNHSNELNTLKMANDFFNQLKFISDTPMKGKNDHWMTPYEFLAEGGGDCEDFAIAKFFTAIMLGVPAEKLRITYVNIKKTNQAHMVLTYYPEENAEPMVLDNLINPIKPASKRNDLAPVYSFGLDHVWLHERMNESSLYGDANNLSKWRELLLRFKSQQQRREGK